MTTQRISSFKRFLAAAGVALAIPLSASAFAGHDGGPGGCGHEGRRGGQQHGGWGGDFMPPQLRGLNLTDAQRDKVFNIMHAQMPAMRDGFKAVHAARTALRQLTLSADYSDAKAKQLADEEAGKLADMAMLRAKTDRQIYAVLTPEQQKQLAAGKGEPRMRRTPSDGGAN